MKNEKTYEVLDIVKDIDDRPKRIRVRAGHRYLELLPGHSIIELILLVIAVFVVLPILAFVVLGTSASSLLSRGVEALPALGLGAVLLLILFLAGWVYVIYFYYNSIYRVWKFAQLSSLPEGKPSPGAAWAFLLIPFFNLYWIFVAFGAVRKHLEDASRQAAGRARPVGSIGAVAASFVLASQFWPILWILPLLGIMSRRDLGAGLFFGGTSIALLYPVIALTSLILILVMFSKWRDIEFTIMAGLADEGVSPVAERPVLAVRPGAAPAGRPQLPSLEFFGGELAGSRIDLAPGREVIIGRDPLHANIVLSNPQVSRMHAHLRFDESARTFVIRDLESNHGVFINGERIPKGTSRVTYGGSRVEIGQGAASFYLKS